LKKHESGVEPQEEEKWQTLSLKELHRPRGVDPVSDVLRGSLVDIADRLLGPFDPKTGAFADMSLRTQVPFHAVPSVDPDRVLGRTTGGGRFYLQTSGLIDSKGPVKLKSGDQIEYCIEVFGAEREPASAIPSARSESRVSTILDEKEFTTWMRLVGQEDERVRQLERLQRSIFERK
jgi:hypothetical protein